MTEETEEEEEKESEVELDNEGVIGGWNGDGVGWMGWVALLGGDDIDEGFNVLHCNLMAVYLNPSSLIFCKVL